MSKDPAVLFYTSDWLTGTALMNYAQKGKYMTLLCLQHQQGHLSAREMKKICGKNDDDILAKFTKDENGLYYNRRMDEEIQKRKRQSQRQRENIQKRWNKNGKGSGNTTVLPLEDESESEDIDIEKKGGSGGKKDIDYMQVWNTKCHLKNITELTPKRKQMLACRLKEHPNSFEKVIENINGSDFLKGENDRGWVATFDWIIKPNNYVKVLEGNYVNEKPPDKNPTDGNDLPPEYKFKE